MPYTFDYDPVNWILRCRLSGGVGDELLREFFRAGADHAILTNPSAGVVDLSDVDSFDVSSRAIEELAKAQPVLSNPNLRRIVIAPASDVYGMMRMFEMEGEQVRPGLHVVRSEQEAWAILGVLHPRFEPLETN